MLRRLVPALALAATAALPAPRALVAQSAVPATALRYQFTMVTAEEKASRGTMLVLGDRARIDVEKGSEARVARGGARVTASSDGGHDWFLLSEGGRRIAIVDDDEEQYSEMDAATFTGIIGTVMRAVDTFMTMEVEQPTVSVERLGDGGTVAGKRTERWAVVQEFTTNVGMLGKTQREMHRVVTDYWIARGLELPDNPLWELVTRGETALAQADKGYVARVARARGALPKGAALRIVVTSASSELPNGTVKAPKVQRLEITDISTVTANRALFEVPRGYEKKDAGKGFSIDF
jgi:hypothetical protein